MPNVVIPIKDIRLRDRIGISGECTAAKFNTDGTFAVKFESDGWYTFQLADYMVTVTRFYADQEKAMPMLPDA